MITIRSTDWHMRLVTWTYGANYFFSYGKLRQINLCPYFWSVVLAVVTAPFVAMYRAFPKPTLSISGQTITFIALVIYAALFTWDVSRQDWYSAGFIVAMTVFLLAGKRLFKLVDSIHIGKRRRREHKLKVHEPNLMIEYLKAKKSKYCPVLNVEWNTVDEKWQDGNK